jgi:hypothetical protein
LRKQQREEDRPPTLAELLAAPVNITKTRRILEFCAPINLFIEIDEKGVYHIIGVPNVPGHFQMGVLAQQKKWTPALDQSRFMWQDRQEHSGYLHYIQRNNQMSPEEGIVLVQHNPTYTKKGKNALLQDINIVLVTPLWDATPGSKVSYQARHTYRCVLMQPCSCEVYLALQQTYAYQWPSN